MSSQIENQTNEVPETLKSKKFVHTKKKSSFSSKKIDDSGNTRKKGQHKRKKNRHVKQSLSSYIYKVLKQVHPDSGITKNGMICMNQLVVDVYERILVAAKMLANACKRETIGAREIQTAVRLIYPGQLAKHAVSEGTKAVVNFNSDKVKMKSASEDDNDDHEHKKKKSRTERSGLTFPVGRLHSYLKSDAKMRIGATTAVYISAILEYIAAEILEMAGNAARDNKVKRVNPRFIFLAIQNDKEVKALFPNSIFLKGGVMPHINPNLLPKTRKRSKRNVQNASEPVITDKN